MLELVTTGQFRKDYKRIKKRGYALSSRPVPQETP